jgi:hypothetical protein
MDFFSFIYAPSCIRHVWSLGKKDETSWLICSSGIEFHKLINSWLISVIVVIFSRLNFFFHQIPHILDGMKIRRFSQTIIKIMNPWHFKRLFRKSFMFFFPLHNTTGWLSWSPIVSRILRDCLSWVYINFLVTSFFNFFDHDLWSSRVFMICYIAYWLGWLSNC